MIIINEINAIINENLKKLHVIINKGLKKFNTTNKTRLINFVVYAENNDLDRKYIDAVLSVFNVLRLKSKYNYVKWLEIPSHIQGSLEYCTQLITWAAKPQYYYDNYPCSEVKKQSYSVYKLKDVKIIGSSNVVLISSKEAMFEPYCHDDGNRWDHTNTVITHEFDKGFFIRYRDSKKVIHSGIMLSGNASYNYYHFIYEFLSKFLFLDKLDLPQNIPIIVDDAVEKFPQYQELLKYFNKLDRDIIYLKSGYRYKVETLYYLPFVNIIPTNYKNIDDIVFTDNLFSFESIQFLRDTLMPNMVATNCKKKIFISRQNASSLRRYNENEVLNVFEKHGFEVVYPENYTVAEQMYLFNNADFIAGATGAAFSNILFCNRGCKILCLYSFVTELSIFSTIAKYLGLDFQYLSAHEKSYKTQDLHEEFVIDPFKVENALVDFLTR